jgi:hypothetical protein
MDSWSLGLWQSLPAGNDIQPPVPLSTTCSECSSDDAGHDLTRRARRATVLEMRHLTRLGSAAVCLVIAAGCSSDNVTAPRGSPVPGTSAFVDHHTVSPIYVGQYIGRLKKVGNACHGRSGTSSTGGWDVSMYIDKNCRVFVSSITRSSGQGGPPPSGGTFVTPKLVTPKPG